MGAVLIVMAFKGRLICRWLVKQEKSMLQQGSAVWISPAPSMTA
jgi:hypothetical protein